MSTCGGSACCACTPLQWGVGLLVVGNILAFAGSGSSAADGSGGEAPTSGFRVGVGAAGIVVYAAGMALSIGGCMWGRKSFPVPSTDRSRQVCGCCGCTTQAGGWYFAVVGLLTTIYSIGALNGAGSVGDRDGVGLGVGVLLLGLLSTGLGVWMLQSLKDRDGHAQYDAEDGGHAEARKSAASMSSYARIDSDTMFRQAFESMPSASAIDLDSHMTL